MSNSAFYHKDGKTSLGIRFSIGIMIKHYTDGLKADSTKCAAMELAEHLYKPSRLGRSYERRCKKMHSAIEVAIERGLLKFSEAEAKLVLTRKGRNALQKHYDRNKRCSTDSRQTRARRPTDTFLY